MSIPDDNRPQPPVKTAKTSFDPSLLITPAASGSTNQEKPGAKIELIPPKTTPRTVSAPPAVTSIKLQPAAAPASPRTPLQLHPPHKPTEPIKATTVKLELIEQRKTLPAADTSQIKMPADSSEDKVAATKWRRWLWLLVPVAAAAAAFWLYRYEGHQTRDTGLGSAVFAANALPEQEVAQTPALSWTSGALRLRTIAYSADGQEISLTNVFAVSLNCPRPVYSLTTNTTMPLLLHNLTVGEYAVTVSATNFYPGKSQLIKITPRQLSTATIVMRPLTGPIQFSCVNTKRVFAVYLGERYLGTTKDSFELPLFIPHSFTIKAPGWRDASATATVTSTETPLLLTVPVERVVTGLELSVISLAGPPPTSGLLQINDSRPIRVPLPLKRDALSYSGEITIKLTIEGYDIINNNRRVLLQDRQSTNVVFRIAPTN